MSVFDLSDALGNLVRHFCLLLQYIDHRPGNFIDIETGQLLGKHSGIHHYTVGQRINVASLLKPYFVQNIDAKSQNIVAVCTVLH